MSRCTCQYAGDQIQISPAVNMIPDCFLLSVIRFFPPPLCPFTLPPSCPLCKSLLSDIITGRSMLSFTSDTGHTCTAVQHRCARANGVAVLPDRSLAHSRDWFFPGKGPETRRTGNEDVEGPIRLLMRPGRARSVSLRREEMISSITDAWVGKQLLSRSVSGPLTSA